MKESNGVTNALNSIDLTYDGLELQIVGSYYPAIPSGSYHEPDEPAIFEIESVLHLGYDITNVLAARVLEQLVELCLENCQS